MIFTVALSIHAKSACSFRSNGPEGNGIPGGMWATNLSVEFCKGYLVHLSCEFLKACLHVWAQEESNLLDRRREL